MLKTKEVLVKRPNRTIIDKFNMPEINCLEDVKEAQEVLGLDSDELLLAIWRGLRNHVCCKIRQKEYTQLIAKD